MEKSHAGILWQKYGSVFDEVIEEILNIAPETCEIWFHGSRVHGTPTHRSDYDFLIILPETTHRDRICELEGRNSPLFAIHQLADIQVSKRSVACLPSSPLHSCFSKGLQIWLRP